MAYYVILGVFFLHPLGIMVLQEYGDASDKSMLAWAVLSFPLVQGIAFLTLLPALRRGEHYVAENGTPWRWPGFPLLLFALLALCVCVRQHFLGLSFLPVLGMESPFGLYSLVTFFIPICVLMIELALVSRGIRARVFALLMPLLMILFSFASRDPNPVYREVLDMVMAAVGSPLRMAVIAGVIVYACAWLRGLREAEAGIVLALLVAATVRGTTVDVNTLSGPQIWPFLAIGGLQIIQAVRKPSSWRAFLVACALISAMTTAWRATWFTAGSGFIPLHMVLASAMVIAVLWRDRPARFMQTACAFALPVFLAGVVFLGGHLEPDFPGWVRPTYGLVLLLVCFAYWRIAGNNQYLAAGAVASVVYLVYAMGVAYRVLREPDRPRGLMLLFWGVVSFTLALTISFLKGGVFQRAYKWLSNLSRASAAGGEKRRD